MEGRLSAQDRQRIVDLYESRLKDFGHDVRTVGWGSQADQVLRFAVLCRGLVLEGARILDVGCGLGDFVAFCEARGVRDYDYVGLDIAPALVKQADTRFGGSRRRFIVADLLDNPDLGSFDLVISSGALSFRTADNIGLAHNMLGRMFAVSTGAVAVNFLSSYVDFQAEKNFHYSPEEMFGFVRSLTRWARLHHDYPLYEFTLQLFHGPNDDRETS